MKPGGEHDVGHMVDGNPGPCRLMSLLRGIGAAQRGSQQPCSRHGVGDIVASLPPEATRHSPVVPALDQPGAGPVLGEAAQVFVPPGLA